MYIPYPPRDYSPVILALNILNLSDCTQNINFTFLSDVLLGNIDSPDLLSLVNFKAPLKDTQTSVNFVIPHCSTSQLLNFPIIHLMCLANSDTSFSF